jgi:hypothetical protein
VLAQASIGMALSARTLVSQHGVPKPGLWKGFSGAPTAAFAAVGYLVGPPPLPEEGLRPLLVGQKGLVPLVGGVDVG